MSGKHKSGYHWPRVGEKRRSRQPFIIDSMPEEVRIEIQKRRARGETWQEIADSSAKFAGRNLPPSMLHRWYGVRFEQVQREVMEMDAHSRRFAALFKEFKDLPEATVNALASQAFNVMNKQGTEGFESSLKDLGVVLAKMMSAKAAADRVKLEKEKLELERQRFEELKRKADRATLEAAAKSSRAGRSLTIDEINRIRERTFGLPPIKQEATGEELEKKIDEIYGVDSAADSAPSSEARRRA